MEKYLDYSNDTIFKYLNLPEAINKDLFVEQCVLRCGEFEVLYPEPLTMQYAIGSWSNKWYKTFERWAETLAMDYNPIENYDRIEEWHDDTLTHGTSSNSSTSSSNSSASNTNQNDKSAYDSNQFRPVEKDTSSSSQTFGSTISNSGTTDASNNNTRTGRAHGNIGVTTNAQMVAEEIKLREWNIIDHMIDLFIKELVIPIY